MVALNADKKLRQTVDSVLTQTCGDYEIVVNDRGSNDGSAEILPDIGQGFRLLISRP